MKKLLGTGRKLLDNNRYDKLVDKYVAERLLNLSYKSVV